MLGVIKINPAVFEDGRDALAVAWNEAIRLWMEDNNFTPQADPTEEQRELLADTAYADDEDALRKTILARIITQDTTAPDPTPEQQLECMELMTQILDSLPSSSPDIESVEAMIERMSEEFGIDPSEEEGGLEAEEAVMEEDPFSEFLEGEDDLTQAPEGEELPPPPDEEPVTPEGGELPPDEGDLEELLGMMGGMEGV